MTLPRKSVLGASLASMVMAGAFLLGTGLVGGQPAQADVPITTALLKQWMLQYSNWGRWGAADELGTVNFITQDVRKAAADEVKLGISVGLARAPFNIKFDPSQPFDPAFPTLAPKPLTTLAIDDPNPFFFWAVPPAFTSDRWNFAMAGIIHSHLDSLCHIASPPSASPDVYPERMVYNGRALATNNTANGCIKNGIANLVNGIFTRGVLYDATRLGYLNEGSNPWLAPGTRVTNADILKLEAQTGVVARKGDVILLYTGHFARRQAKGAWASQCTVAGAVPGNCGEPGWWYDNIPYFHDREIAQFGSDAWNDVTPAGGDLDNYTTLPYHGFQAALGINHYDNLDLEALADLARRLNRYEFLFTVGPFPVVGGVTSPTNPIAVF